MFSFLLFAGGALVTLFFILLFLATCVFWIWMLISAIQNQGLTGTERVIWVLVIFFLHFLGAFLYLLLGRPKRLNQST
jgi:hypothetical protein